MTGNLWILLAAGGAVVAVFVALSMARPAFSSCKW